jgi:hypothetical protein
VSTPRVNACAVVFAAALHLVVGCRREARAVEPGWGPRSTPAEADRGELCADVGEARACWGSGIEGPECKAGICSSPRTLPRGAAPSPGWRCDGNGQARVCEERSRNAGPWDCDGGRCLQRSPRLPDDGEWSCVDMDGATYCHGGRLAAGVAPAKPDLGWICGARQNGPAGERVCVDFAPDRPGDYEPTKCHFEYGAEPGRLCATDGAPLLGDPCTAQVSCPSGSVCAGGRCLPPRPSPGCWFDADCGKGGRCRWATCFAEGAR